MSGVVVVLPVLRPFVVSSRVFDPRFQMWPTTPPVSWYRRTCSLPYNVSASVISTPSWVDPLVWPDRAESNRDLALRRRRQPHRRRGARRARGDRRARRRRQRRCTPCTRLAELGGRSDLARR